jgi:hypothetical protein
MDKVFEILKKHFNELRQYPNVLNANVGEEITKGKKTGRRAIVVFVSQKKPLSVLPEHDRLPDEVEGVPVDVIEWKAEYKLGDTAPSHLDPETQRRISSGVRHGK